MATRYRTKGFVFKKNDSLESDRTFNIFSEDFGRLEVRGKAIRKINSKLKSGISLFCLSEIEFIEGKSHKTLTDAAFLEKFDNIFLDAKKAEIAFRVAGILDDFLKGQQKDENIFFLLDEIFRKINSNFKNTDLLYCYFIWNFLASQGYAPEVEKCALCKENLNPSKIYFSCKEGGVVCGKCFNADTKAMEINSDIVKILRIILDKNWEMLSKLKIGEPSQKLLKGVSEIAVCNLCPS